jgi:hypothetical protein
VNGQSSAFSGTFSESTWQFPLVAKYMLPVPRLSRAKFKPFAEARPSFRTVQTDFGFTAGVGVSFRYGMLTFQPRIRYTRWQANSSGLKSDEANLLLGVTFQLAAHLASCGFCFRGMEHLNLKRGDLKAASQPRMAALRGAGRTNGREI